MGLNVITVQCSHMQCRPHLTTGLQEGGEVGHHQATVDLRAFSWEHMSSNTIIILTHVEDVIEEVGVVEEEHQRVVLVNGCNPNERL